MLELKNINIKYGKKECIKNGNFKASPGMITGLYGESGTGKSSLLYALGMLSDQRYEYYYNNEKQILNEKEKSKFRNKHISFITQNSILIENLTVEKNIEFFLNLSCAEYTVEELLSLINLLDKKEAMPISLSSGERQRVAIACALANDSDIILGDEITSALDEDNKEMIVHLLRKCANKGKIVILVSHEKKILDGCDRLYKIEHLELILEKETNKEMKLLCSKDVKKKENRFKTFQILFMSNKRIKRRVKIYSSILVLIIFACSSIITSSFLSSAEAEYNLEDVSNRKLVIISDYSETAQDNEWACTQRSLPYYQQQPIFEEDLEKLNQVNHIQSIYNCYIFHTNGAPSSHQYLDDSIIASRNGKQLEKKDNLNGYSFDVIPIYPEESIYPKQENGVYVSTFLADIYNLEIGDDLDVKLEVPYAQQRNIGKTQGATFGDGGKPYQYSWVATTSMRYQVKVEGIIDGNSWESQEIYMRYDVMEKFVDEQLEIHKDDEYGTIINGMTPQSTYEKLEVYSKVVFVDKYENVLKVQKNIHNISKRLYAYNEYLTVSNLMSEAAIALKDAIKISLVVSLLFMIGAGIVEFFYLLKYKSTYMILKLIGYKKINIFMIMNLIYHIIVSSLITSIIYITSTLPDILPALNILDFNQIWQKLDDSLKLYYTYCHFSIMHFIILTIVLIVVVAILNIGFYVYYNRKDLIKWLRGG